MADPINDGPVILTVDHVRRIMECTQALATKWHPYIKASCDAKEITTILRLSGFLAQVKIESAALKTVEENLNYTADRLQVVFPKYFPDQATALLYARQPSKIGARVYANRLGNGPESGGEGYLYRGRGLIQITGKQNYQSCTRGGVECIKNPDNLLGEQGASDSAAWFWQSKNLNAYADRGLIDKISKLVNGGTNAQAERRTAYALAIKVLSGTADDQATPEVQPARTDDIEQQPTAAASVGKFSEPASQAHSVYPWNEVFESRSGHVIEIDDTPGAERLHWLHRTGTYMEMNPDGSFVQKTKLDRYDITDSNLFISAGGNKIEKVEGQAYHRYGGDTVFYTDGQLFLESAQLVQVNAPVLSASSIIRAPTGDFQALSSVDVADLKARDSEHADFADDIGGPAGAAVGGVRNSMSFDDSGNPSFTKPVTNQQAVTMNQPTVNPVLGPVALPDPVANKNAIALYAPLIDGIPTAVIFSNGTNWIRADTGAIVS